MSCTDYTYCHNSCRGPFMAGQPDPHASDRKSILNTVVIILLVVWLLQVFGLLDYLRQLRV
jgi:hypothetical protein